MKIRNYQDGDDIVGGKTSMRKSSNRHKTYQKPPGHQLAEAFLRAKERKGGKHFNNASESWYKESVENTDVSATTNQPKVEEPKMEQNNANTNTNTNTNADAKESKAKESKKTAEPAANDSDKSFWQKTKDMCSNHRGKLCLGLGILLGAGGAVAVSAYNEVSEAELPQQPM